MGEKRVIPHTRNCSSHWDGECNCAPRTREHLEQIIAAQHQSVLRWKQYAESPTQGDENARANLPPEPARAGPGWSGRTETPVLMWDGPLDFAAIPDDPREARQLLSAKLQAVGDQLWAAMLKLKEWESY